MNTAEETKDVPGRHTCGNIDQSSGASAVQQTFKIQQQN